MNPTTIAPEQSLYERDETAWLEATSEALRLGLYENVDLPNLAEYLSDMAKRERREVRSRSVQLLMHILKWEHQPDKRTTSWRTSILEQSQQLKELAGNGVLRVNATDVLPKAYDDAVVLAASATNKKKQDFPTKCAFSLGTIVRLGVSRNRRRFNRLIAQTTPFSTALLQSADFPLSVKSPPPRCR